MTPEVPAEYAAHGVTKDNAIVTPEYRAAHPCDFVNHPNDDANWVTLTTG